MSLEINYFHIINMYYITFNKSINLEILLINRYY